MKIYTILSMVALSLIISSLSFASTSKKDDDFILEVALGLNPKSEQRKPSQTATVSDDNFSAEFKKFRDDKYFKIKTAGDLEKVLIDADKNYESYPLDMKYYIAQAEIIRPLRGIIYRLRPIFEQNKSVQAAAVTSIKSYASSMMIYLPTDQWKAGFDYATVPSTDDATSKQFKTVREFQDYMISDIIPAYKTAAARLAVLAKKESNIRIPWDNKLIFGANSFTQGDLNVADRYALHTESEFSAALAGLTLQIHSMYAFCAYNQDDLLNVAQSMGRLVGINGFLPQEYIGVTDQQRHSVLNQYPKFMTIKKEKGEDSRGIGYDYMATSLKYLKAGVIYTRNSWQSMPNEPGNSFNVLNSARFSPDSRQINLRIKNMEDMVKGPTSLHSVMTGDIINVNYTAFYTNPPEDLHKLLPQSFEGGKEEKDDVISKSGKVLKYRNYYKGRATGWNSAAWTAYFPSGDMAKNIRVLKESWGGDYLSPVVAFVAQ